MKQTRLFLLAALLLSAISSWAHDFEVDGIYYNFISKTDKTVTVTSKYNDFMSRAYSGSVIIPSSVIYEGTTYSVVSIGYGAFWQCTRLTSVTIPNSVKSIEGSAFYTCIGLTSISIPNSVVSIGSMAFGHCSGLLKVEYESIESLCNIKFADDESNPLVHARCLYIGDNEITDVVIPNSVTSIGNYTFCGCSGLTSVTIHNSVTEIGNSAFYGCSGLTSVAIPNSVRDW